MVLIAVKWHKDHKLKMIKNGGKCVKDEKENSEIKCK